MKTLFRGLALIILFFAFSFSAFSQTITGKIIDEEGYELPGVSIYVEGTTIGTTSDVFGAYALIIKEGDVAGDSLTIIYSFVSFSSQTTGDNL